jgi:hypothetical protein
MTVTVEVLRNLQKEAAGLCPECLREHIADNTAVLGDLLDIAENMSAIRHSSFDNEELYQRAFAEVMAAVMITAVFTAELNKRPFAVAVSAN